MLCAVATNRAAREAQQTARWSRLIHCYMLDLIQSVFFPSHCPFLAKLPISVACGIHPNGERYDEILILRFDDEAEREYQRNGSFDPGS